MTQFKHGDLITWSELAMERKLFPVKRGQVMVVNRASPVFVWPMGQECLNICWVRHLSPLEALAYQA